MGNSYTFGSGGNIQSGSIIRAQDFTTEFTNLNSAFDGTGGHTHDGTAGEGGRILEIGPAGQVVVDANTIKQSSSKALEIGATNNLFKNVFIADDNYVKFGDSQDATIGYDETSTDRLLFTGANIRIGNTNKIIEFGDAASFIQQSSDGVLRIDGEATINLNASTAVAVSVDLTVGNDLKLNTDSSILGFGQDNDTTLTHTDGTGLTLNSTNKLCFNDATQFIQGSSATVLSLGATDEIDLTATTIDVNATTLDVSGDISIGGDIVTVSNTNIDLLPHGTGKIIMDGNGSTGGISVSDGLIDIRTGTGAVAKVKFYCEDANQHAQTLQAQPHSASSSAVVVLPIASGTLLGSGDAVSIKNSYLLDTDIKIGEDDETKIDFETADEIHFYAANVEQVYLADNIFGPQSDSDVDLGTTGVRWKDAYVDSVTVTDNVTIGGTLTVNGTTTTVNSTVTTIADPIITLGANASDDNKDRGIEFKYNDGSARVGFFGYDDSVSKFTMLTAATNSSEVFSGTTGTLVANVEGNVTGDVTGIHIGTIKAGASTQAFTFPNTDGSAGQFLKTDAAGNLSFSTVSTDTVTDNLAFTSDDAKLTFGANNEIELIHVHNSGLTIKNTLSTATTPVTLNLKSEEDEITDGDVIGKLLFTAGDSDGGDGEVTSASIEAEADAAFSSTVNSTDLVFKLGTDGAVAEKMRLAHEGVLSIPADGSTTTNGIHIGAGADLIMFHESGDSKIKHTTGSGHFKLLADSIALNNAAEGANLALFTAGGAAKLYFNGSEKIATTTSGIDVSGAIVADGDITAFSDERLKSDVKTIDNALDKVMNMRGVSYTKQAEKGVGVIAQEIEKVLPEVVTDGEYKSVAYGNIVGVLIEAIKEQQKQIDELKKDK